MLTAEKAIAAGITNSIKREPHERRLRRRRPSSFVPPAWLLMDPSPRPMPAKKSTTPAIRPWSADALSSFSGSGTGLNKLDVPHHPRSAKKAHQR